MLHRPRHYESVSPWAGVVFRFKVRGPGSLTDSRLPTAGSGAMSSNFSVTSLGFSYGTW